MLVQLRDGELDLGLGLFPEVPEHIRVQPLFTESYVSIADKNTLPVESGLSFECWLKRPHVLVALSPDSNDEIEQTLALMGLQRRIAVVLPHWGMAVDLLPGTDLVLTVASRALEFQSPNPLLRQFEPPLELSRFAYKQGWHIRSENDPAHRWLREAVLACS
jgi:DNA-binding transcriptional LysR family regulator